MIASEALGIPMGDIEVIANDTDLVPVRVASGEVPGADAVASYLFNIYFQHGAPGSFVATFASFTTTSDMELAMVKAVVYGAIVGVVACQKGLNTSGGSMGVANAVNSSVVESILLLMISNVAISQMYLILFPKTGL